MEASRASAVDFRLSSPALTYAVDVRIWCAAERWIAETTVGGVRHVGLAATPRAALDAALSVLSDRDVRLLLADLVLLAPSVAIARMARGWSA